MPSVGELIHAGNLPCRATRSNLVSVTMPPDELAVSLRIPKSLLQLLELRVTAAQGMHGVRQHELDLHIAVFDLAYLTDRLLEGLQKLRDPSCAVDFDVNLSAGRVQRSHDVEPDRIAGIHDVRGPFDVLTDPHHHGFFEPLRPRGRWGRRDAFFECFNTTNRLGPYETSCSETSFTSEALPDAVIELHHEEPGRLGSNRY